MKKYLLCFSVACFALYANAQQNCQISQQQPIQLLSAEIARSFKTLRKQNPPIYYLSYTYTQTTGQRIYVEENGVRSHHNEPQSVLEVQARAGSTGQDNTRTLKNDATNYEQLTTEVPLITGNGKAFTTAVWRATQTAAEEALQGFNRVKADVQTSSKRADDSPDFVFPPAETFCREVPPLQFNMDNIKSLLLGASQLTRGKKFVLSSSFSFNYETGSRYFADSVGTRLKTPIQLARLAYTLEGKTADGSTLTRTQTYDVLTEKELPNEERLFAAVKQSMAELEALTTAPEAEPITVPAILKNRAMAVFVHEVLGHRVEGHRQKEDSFGKTFTDKLGQQVVSPLLTIVDDATLAYFNNIPLRGFYEYDDEGVKARPVVLIENGVLKNFLMNSSPIKGFPVSNGHGRGEAGRRPVARMGNTRVIASKTVSYPELEQKLLAEIKRQHKPYGYIIEDLSGGFTMTQTNYPQTFKLKPTLAYRIYPDGRKEVVRGADMVGTPLVSFNEVIAAADDYDVFNGSCGAESGWVPVSGIAPSVLLRKLEIEKTGKSNVKPPLLLPPFAEGK